MTKVNRFKRAAGEGFKVGKISRIARNPKRNLEGTAYARICADIREDLHTQFKMYAASNKKTIVGLIEEWITLYCKIDTLHSDDSANDDDKRTLHE